MEFTKMQGIGNDFIIINNMIEKIPIDKLSKLAKHLCKRKMSLGADGLMVVDFPETEADFKMRFYNSDGSLGEMCGNGARCIARYAYLNKISEKKVKIETLAGIIEAELVDERTVKVLMNNPSEIRIHEDKRIDEHFLLCDYLELGDPGLPHLIVNMEGLEDLEEDEIFAIGRKLRYHKDFPKGSNVNFYRILDEETVSIKTYERGVEDFTLACGTGSVATAALLRLKGYFKGEKIKVINPGRELSVEVILKNFSIHKLYLIGSTNLIGKGQILDEDLGPL